MVSLLGLFSQDVDAFAAFKRKLKGSNAEHYSVRDHGEAGRRRGEELEQEEEQERQQELERQGQLQDVQQPQGGGLAGDPNVRANVARTSLWYNRRAMLERDGYASREGKP